MLKLIVLFILLGLIPLILGLPWTKAIKARYSIAFAYGIGYFIELVLFHIVCFTFASFNGHFSVLVWLYSFLLLFACLACLIFAYKNEIHPWNTKKSWQKLYWHEWILLIAFILTVGYQIYQGYTTDPTYMSYDDSIYTTIANDAIVSDTIGRIDAYTGIAITLNMLRSIQTSLYFPAYLSVVSGISVTTMEHTIQYEQFVVLAYAIYIYVAGELFEKRDNRLVFLALVSMFYIFGYHSHYSLTFRLLGPNYQGKAVLAVSLTPLILTILIQALKESYKRETGILLLILSLSAVSLTLWGTGTVLVIVTIPIVLSLIRKGKEWKHLLYIPWSIMAPVLFVAINTIYKSYCLT